jgi:hypothetical protein
MDKCLFDLDKTVGGLTSLRQYRQKMDPITQLPIPNSAVHDKHSHPADAFRVLCIGLKTHGSSSQRATGAYGNYDPYKVNYDTASTWDVFNS